MANEKKLAEALESVERPQVKWKIVGLVVAVLAVVWLIAGMATPTLGYWGFVGAGILTLLAAGFGGYLWFMMKKSAGILDVLQGATDAEGRAAALERLSAKDPKGKDALNAIAKAQLMAQGGNVKEAITTLEALEIDKVSFMVQDQVRATLAMFYLWYANRAKDARKLIEEIRIDRAGQSQDKAFLAAISAEAYARTGKTDEAGKLLETYSSGDGTYANAKPALLRAEIYHAFKMKRKNKAKKAMQELGSVDVNALGSFVQKGHPELQRMAKDVAQKAMGIKPQYQRPKNA